MVLPPRRSRLLLGLALLALGAAGCATEIRRPDRLEGTRIPVMVQDSGLSAHPDLAETPVAVPPPEANAAWTQAGGNAAHTMHHLALGPDPKRRFSVDIGSGSTSERRLLAQPVADEGGRIYTLDARAGVTAFDAETGKRLWKRDLRPEGERGGTLGAGLAVDQGRLFVTTGFAQVVALDAATGEELWRRRRSAPFRSAPAVAEGKVFAVSIDNRTHALDAETGEELWTHRGTTEVAQLLGGAAPAYQSGVLVVAYSSGELFGLVAANGRELWSDFLALARRTSGLSSIIDIRAAPVIDRGRVFAVSNAGRMVALSLSSGARIWQQRFASAQSPWVAGAWIYLVTTDNVLLCIAQRDGRIRWARSLPRYEDPEDREGLITWTGPVLAGDRLVLAGSNERALAVSPYTGDLLGSIGLPDRVEVPPLVVRNTLYFLTEDADLVSWR